MSPETMILELQRIILDFKNRWVVIQDDYQCVSEEMWWMIQKQSMKDYLPADKEVYLRGEIFTLDFTVNKVYLNKSIDYAGQCDYPKLEIEQEYASKNLNMQWDDVIEWMGYC